MGHPETAGAEVDGECRHIGSAFWLCEAVRQQNAALHLDCRDFGNGWKIDAHTVELAWHQALGNNWRIAPGLRWYSQSQSYFHAWD